MPVYDGMYSYFLQKKCAILRKKITSEKIIAYDNKKKN